MIDSSNFYSCSTRFRIQNAVQFGCNTHFSSAGRLCGSAGDLRSYHATDIRGKAGCCTNRGRWTGTNFAGSTRSRVQIWSGEKQGVPEREIAPVLDIYVHVFHKNIYCCRTIQTNITYTKFLQNFITTPHSTTFSIHLFLSVINFVCFFSYSIGILD